MWAQLVKARIKAGREEDLRQVYEEANRSIGRDSGWVRSFSLRNQRDHQEMYGLAIFEE
jgi:hypothetical protein